MTRPELSGARILVTGGCGFIGSHLVEALVNCHAEVWVLDNLNAGSLDNLALIKDRITFIMGDVREQQFVEAATREIQPQYVYHLAANASVPGSVDDPAYDFETNSAGTFVLLNALRGQKDVIQVVLASSGAVYGQPDRFPIMETHVEQPISPYGASKTCAETIARMFCKVYGLPIVIARIFNTYGPRMARFVILDFLRKLHRDPGLLQVLGDGQQKRDFTYVSDTVGGLIILATQGAIGEAYNLSSGNSTSVTEVAKMLISVLGLDGHTHIEYTGSSWIGDAQRWEVSIEKLGLLGYRPRVTLPEGLAATTAWFQAGKEIESNLGSQEPQIRLFPRLRKQR